MQFAGAILAAMMHCFNTCTTSVTVFHASYIFGSIFGSLGISIIFTNLLSHRYMLQRATIISEVSAMEAEEHNLEKLNRLFMVEVRAVPFAFVCPIVFYGVGVVGGLVASNLFFMVTLMTDGAFTFSVTRVFLRPVLAVLHMAQGQVKTAASERLKRTKWLNLVGVGTVVLSSSVLYIHLIAHYTLYYVGSPILFSSSWGNPEVFSMNFVQMLNNVGMVLISGVLKDVSWKGSWKALSTKIAPLTVASNAVAQQPFQFDSRAYEKENETEAEVGSGCAAPENGKLAVEEQCTPLPSDDNLKKKVQKMPAL